MKVSVIGLGHVGSVAAAGLASKGHDVIGIDSDIEKVNAFRRGLVPIYERPEIVAADWRAIARHTKPRRFLLDGRNALDSVQMRTLGFDYHGVGRGAKPSNNSQATADGGL